MSGKAIDSSASGCLVLILPVAVLISFLLATWPILLALLVFGVSWNVWQRYQWQKWSQQVNPIFHQLILQNKGYITALDLAIKANFSAEIAKRYLETKAGEFGAQRQDYKDRGSVYYFITVSTLGSIFDDSELPNQSEQQDEDGKDEFKRIEDSEGKVDRRIKDESDSSLHSSSFTRHPPQKPSSLSSQSSLKDEKQAKLPLNRQLVFGSLIQAELARRLDVHSSTVYKRRDDPDFSEWSRSKDPEGIAWEYSPETKEFFPLEGSG